MLTGLSSWTRGSHQRAISSAWRLVSDLLLHGAEGFFKPPGVEHVFETRLGAVGAVAMVDEDAHHGVRDPGRVGGLDHDSGIVCEAAMPGDAAEPQPEPDARLDAETVLHLDRLR